MAGVSHATRVKKHCLSLPESTLELKWESVYFCVNGKIFCGCGERDGHPCVTVKSDRTIQAGLLKRQGFYHPAYVGHAGWVGVLLDTIDWAEARELITDSYRRVAPKKLSALL
jgi:predicted DNA-binding protein (MmcQ/YjbR family)